MCGPDSSTVKCSNEATESLLFVCHICVSVFQILMNVLVQVVFVPTEFVKIWWVHISVCVMMVISKLDRSRTVKASVYFSGVFN